MSSMKRMKNKKKLQRMGRRNTKGLKIYKTKNEDSKMKRKKREREKKKKQ